MNTPNPENGSVYGPAVPPEKITGPLPLLQDVELNKKKPRKRRRWLGYAITGAACLIAGIGMGSAGGSEPAAAEPVVKEVPGPVQTVTEKVEVDKTPAECIDALDYASEAMSTLSVLPGYVAEAAEAGIYNDAATIERITADMQNVNSEIERLTPLVGDASQTCRASAE